MTARTRPTRTAVIIASLLALVAVAIPSVASAASLNVRGAVVTSVAAQRCDDAIEVRPRTGQPVLTRGTTTLFEVRGLAAACAGASIEVALVGANGAALGTARADVPRPFAGGVVNIATSQTVFVPNVRKVSATVGTWGVPATWVLPGSVLPLVICTTESGGACTPSEAREVSASVTTLALSRGSIFFGWFYKDRLLINMGHEYWAGRTNAVVQGGYGGVSVEGWSCASNVLDLQVINGYYAVEVTISAYASPPAGALSCSAP